MAELNVNRAEFVRSAASPEAFIRDSLPRIVFAGKSNVGKSSVINRLLNRKNFARVGSQPGKTIHVNYFKIDGRCWFVDLPGYGYAAVAKAERDRWARLMESFFAEPDKPRRPHRGRAAQAHCGRSDHGGMVQGLGPPFRRGGEQGR